MIERCNYCGEEHETGKLPPFEGVPVVTCPEANRSNSAKMYPPGYARAMYRLGYIKCVVQRMPEPDRHVHDYRMHEVSKYPPLRGFAYDESKKPDPAPTASPALNCPQAVD